VLQVTPLHLNPVSILGSQGWMHGVPCAVAASEAACAQPSSHANRGASSLPWSRACPGRRAAAHRPQALHGTASSWLILSGTHSHCSVVIMTIVIFKENTISQRLMSHVYCRQNVGRTSLEMHEIIAVILSWEHTGTQDKVVPFPATHELCNEFLKWGPRRV